MDSYVKKLTKFIKKKRKATGLSVNQFAAEYDMECSSLCRYELAQREPKIGALRKIAAVYGQTLSDFFDEFERDYLKIK